MKKVLISQRSDFFPDRSETFDGVDTRFSEILWGMGFLPITASNSVGSNVSYIEALAPDAILLTGGNDIGTTPDRDATERAMLDFSIVKNLPVFGICRGMQMMNIYQGGSLISTQGHVSTRHLITGAFCIQSREVNSYHNMSITKKTLGQDLEILASTQDGCVEAFRHKSLPWLAVMWHPERENPINNVDLDVLFSHLDKANR